MELYSLIERDGKLHLLPGENHPGEHVVMTKPLDFWEDFPDILEEPVLLLDLQLELQEGPITREELRQAARWMSEC